MGGGVHFSNIKINLFIFVAECRLSTVPPSANFSVSGNDEKKRKKKGDLILLHTVFVSFLIHIILWNKAECLYLLKFQLQQVNIFILVTV